MKKRISITLISVLVLYSWSVAASGQSDANKTANAFTHELAVYLPETVSAMGFEEYDACIDSISLDLDDKLLAFYRKWYEKLEPLVAKAETEDKRVDLKILMDYVKDKADTIKLRREAGLIPFVPGTQLVFQGLDRLSNASLTPSRKKAMIERFHRYVQSNMLAKSQAYMLALIEQHSTASIYPTRAQVTDYLRASQAYVDATQKLLSTLGDNSYQKDFALYQTQVKHFDLFIKKEILPHARQKAGLPLAVYHQALSSYGVKPVSIDAMVTQGKQDYAKVYLEYQTLAQKIAKKYQLAQASPKPVIQFLKKKKLTTPNDVLKLYQNTSKQIDEIIDKNKLVTLPNTPLNIRLATLGESKAHPSSYVHAPPVINPMKIPPIFIVPTSSHGLPYDDFSYPAIAVALVGHEGRPGHDLQFRHIASEKIGLARAFYAKRSAHTEGWALYAEDLIYPYVDLEAQFGILQLRLHRIARYFLEPLVQQNKATEADVISILHDEIGLSKELAKVDYRRYTYLSPGKAPAYYDGLLRIQALKKQLSHEFGTLQPKCFHDTLLSFGLMSMDYVLMLKEKFQQCQRDPSQIHT